MKLSILAVSALVFSTSFAAAGWAEEDVSDCSANPGAGGCRVSEFVIDLEGWAEAPGRARDQVSAFVYLVKGAYVDNLEGTPAAVTTPPLAPGDSGAVTVE